MANTHNGTHTSTHTGKHKIITEATASVASMVATPLHGVCVCVGAWVCGCVGGCGWVCSAWVNFALVFLCDLAL